MLARMGVLTNFVQLQFALFISPKLALLTLTIIFWQGIFTWDISLPKAEIRNLVEITEPEMFINMTDSLFWKDLILLLAKCLIIFLWTTWSLASYHFHAKTIKCNI